MMSSFVKSSLDIDLNVFLVDEHVRVCLFRSGNMGILWSCIDGLWDSLAVGRNMGKLIKVNCLLLS